MPRSGGDERVSLTKGADGNLISNEPTVVMGKLGRTCAQQQKQSSSCGALSGCWSGRGSAGVVAAATTSWPSLAGRSPVLNVAAETVGRVIPPISSSQKYCGIRMSAPVNSRKKTARERTKRPCRFLIELKVKSAFISRNPRIENCHTRPAGSQTSAFVYLHA